jgi:hypothetical protein
MTTFSYTDLFQLALVLMGVGIVLAAFIFTPRVFLKSSQSSASGRIMVWMVAITGFLALISLTKNSTEIIGKTMAVITGSSASNNVRTTSGNVNIIDRHFCKDNVLDLSCSSITVK